MAFDAGMVRAVVLEADAMLRGARIEKINQPEKDEIVLTLHTYEGQKKLSISASANNPKVLISTSSKENPASPPTFCTLARKKISGARILSIEQIGFERVVLINLDAKDDMGFSRVMKLYAEIMGRYSNIVLCEEDGKILGAIKPVDFTTSSKRQLLPGMKYSLPPSQDKQNPLEETEEGFMKRASESPSAASDKFITSSYIGISTFMAREIAHRSVETVGVSPRALCKAFFEVMSVIKRGEFTPYIYIEGERPIEYSFIKAYQYGAGITEERCDSISAMIERFYLSRDNRDRTRQRADDLFKIISNAKSKLLKKIAVQTEELSECARKDEYKRMGDLITSNMYMLKKGMSRAEVVDYYSENCDTVTITLDIRLTPAQNAQVHYKKYTKLKTAEGILSEQIEKAKAEIAYLETVEDSLVRAIGASEIEQIREELVGSGYLSAGKRSMSRPQRVKPKGYYTSGGYLLLCGKNNTQNDEITLRASKTDWWFHVKGAPGSHVVMVCDGEEPDAKDFTEAAALAAFSSSVSTSPIVDVDYTQIRYIKKPSGSKPGFVTYTTYWSAHVKPCEPAEKA